MGKHSRNSFRLYEEKFYDSVFKSTYHGVRSRFTTSTTFLMRLVYTLLPFTPYIKNLRAFVDSLYASQLSPSPPHVVRFSMEYVSMMGGLRSNNLLTSSDGLKTNKCFVRSSSTPGG